MTFKEGDVVETVYGEEVTVLKVDENHKTKKNKVIVREGDVRILAISGGHPTWFPIEKIKGLVD